MGPGMTVIPMNPVLKSITRFFKLCLIISNISLVSPVFADVLIHPIDWITPGTAKLEAELRSQWITSDANFSEGNQLTRPTTFVRYSRSETDLSAKIAFTPWWTAFARSTWGYVLVDEYNAAGQMLEGSTFGFGDQTVGSSIRPFQLGPDLAMDFQTQIDLPTYTTPNTLSPQLGNGSIDWTTSVFLSASLSRTTERTIVLFGGVGFTYRTSSYSLAVPFSFGIETQPRLDSGLSFRADLMGHASLKTDGTLNLPREGSAGGSYFVNAANSTALGVRIRSAYQFRPWVTVGLEGSTLFFGEQIPQAYAGGLFAQFRWGLERSSLPQQSHLNLENQGGQFENYDLDASVLDVNDRLNSLRINQGESSSIRRGQIFDIFETGSDGNPRRRIARARVQQVAGEQSTLQIVEYFIELWIDKGFIAKRRM